MAGFLGRCGRLWLRWLLTGPVGASGSTCTSAATVTMLLQSLTLGAHQKACDVSRSPAEVCESYCSYECSFFNESAGETGAPANITVFRITPTNVTGIQNKDTGDPSGDITFLLSRKYLAQECARDPTAFGCFLDGNNIYGKFEVEVDGQFGPYFECNPVNVFDQVELDPITQQPPPAWGLGNSYPSPAWIDTRTFECGQGCLQPTAGNCNTYAKKNGTSNFGNAWSCWCDGTGRHNKTVGREAAPYSQHYAPGPAAWVPQCRLAFEEYEAPFTKKRARCVEGTPLRQLSGGWSFESISAMACDACAADAKCEGWRTDDNRTATLLGGRVRASDDEGCVGGVKASHTYPGSSWGTAGDLGGYWFSTPLTAECAAGAPLGTDGCAWRVTSSTYRNASCVDKRVDEAVEAYGAVCFSTCHTPLNRTSDCYLSCYKNALLGDAAFNLTAMPHHQIITPWEAGFGPGGCAVIEPAHCEGTQCGDRKKPAQLQASPVEVVRADA